MKKTLSALDTNSGVNMQKIFLSGSCRIKNLKKEDSVIPYSSRIHHTHTTKECIQYLNYAKGLIDIPAHIENKVFQSYINNIINEKPIVKINRKKIQNEYQSSSWVVAEICSRKVYENEGFYLFHMAVDKGNMAYKEFEDKPSSSFKIQTNEELHQDLKEIKKVTSDKKLLIVSHMNFKQFEVRQDLINSLESSCDDLGIHFLDASKIINEQDDIIDVNHYTAKGYSKIKKEVNLILNLEADTKNNEKYL